MADNNLTLSAPQWVFLNELKTPYIAFVGGFGSGKTFVACLKLLLFAAENPGLTLGYFAPTYSMIKDIFYSTIEEAADLVGATVSIATATKVVTVKFGDKVYGSIFCRSLDTPSRIVGFKIAMGVCDEIDTMGLDKATLAWRYVVARLRQKIPGGKLNQMCITTTPEGFGFVYKTFAENPSPKYSMVQASSYENEEFLSEGYIENLKETYPRQIAEAYINGEFLNMESGNVYYAFDRKRNASSEEVLPTDHLHVGMDFNVTNMNAVVFVERVDAESGKSVYHAVDEFIGVYDTPDMCGHINSKYLGHRITVYPDASGANRSTVNASTTDLSIIKNHGFRVVARKKNPKIKDRVLTMNAAFEKSRMFINLERCPKSVNSVEQQAYDKNGRPDKTNGHDHANDAMGYFASAVLPVNKPVSLHPLNFVS